MALDPNIALGVRPLELANPLAQYGQVAQIQAAQQAQQMNALKMQEYQRNVESQNALRRTPAPEGVNPEHWKIDPKEALALAKTAAETKNLGATYGHLTAQTNDLTIKALGSTFDNFTKLNPPTVAAASPEGVAAYIKNLYADPLLGAVAAKQMPLDEAIKINTEGWAKDPKAWATAHMGLTGEKLFNTLKGTRQNVNQGGTSLGQTVDAYGRVVPGSAVNTAMTATPDAKMANVVAQGNLAVNQAREARLAQGPVGTSLTPEQNDALFGENGAVALGKINPNKINSRNAKMWADAFTRNPNADPVKVAQDVATADKAIKDFGTGPQGVKVTAFNTAIDHLDTLSKLGAAMQSGDIKAVNSFANTLGIQTGQPMATMFNQASRIVGGEISKAIVPGVGTKAEREESANAFNAAMSPEQLKGADAVAKKLLGGQLSSLEQQYKRTTKRSDFAEQLLSPAARAAYQTSRPAETPISAAIEGPKAGAVQNGYRFKGGNPADQSSWEKL